MEPNTQINMNIDDYSLVDLLAILNITDDNPTQYQIKDEANKIISKLKTERKPELAAFIENAVERIINTLINEEFLEEEEPEEYYENDKGNIQYNENTQQGNWWQNQYPAQADEVERTKPTDRKQKVEIFDKDGIQNNAFVMNRERLGVLQSHPIPVVQGTINPNLKNIISRIVSVNSQYRSNIIPYTTSNLNSPNSPTFNTDFTCDLSERLSNVVSMKLNSIQIPTSWYIFDDSLGNTCFILENKNISPEPIFVKIPSGNYTIPFLNAYFSRYPGAPPTATPINLNLYITVDIVTGKLIFVSSNGPATLIFYDTKLFNSCLDNSCGSSQMRINQNFGWSLGYRTIDEERVSINIEYQAGQPNLPINQEPPPCLTVITPPAPPPTPALPSPSTLPGDYYYNIAQSPANLYGPTYFLLVVDDYNNNRVNNSLVTITNVSNKLDLPSYYSPAYKNANNTFATIGCPSVLNATDPELRIQDSALPYMTKSSPRQLTQSQLYTANEILFNRSTFSNKTFGPSTADVLALIPLSGIGALRTKIAYNLDPSGNVILNSCGYPTVSLANSQSSQPYIEFATNLEANERTYFGPVNIDRLRVRLIDDKGNLVNLNDVDWSFSLIVDQLYQY